MHSGWFDCTEPSLATLLQGKQGVQGASELVLGGSSTANLLELSRTIEIARCGAFCPRSSGWFDCTEPSVATLLQGKQGVQGAHSGWFKHSESPRTFSNHRDSKVWSVLSQEFGVVRLYRTFCSYFVTGETRCAGCSFGVVQAQRISSNFLEP